MKSLIELLGKDEAAAPDNSDVASADDSAGDDTHEGFNAAASEAFDALESKDVDGFVSALKSCIEMFK